MTRFSAAQYSALLLPLMAAVALGTLSMSASAQGTDEQREACAPDAIRLCSDTIPDIAKTTACMRAHKAELSLRCQAAFPGATEASPTPDTPVIKPRRKAVRAPSIEGDAPAGQPRPPAADDDFPDQYPPGYGPSGRDPETVRAELHRARAVIRHLCYHGVIDRDTCAVTYRALNTAH